MRLLLTTILLLMLASEAGADDFQVVHRGGDGSESYVTHLSFEILGAGGTVLFRGRTDGQGRVRIDGLRRGTYQTTVSYRNRTYRIQFTINGGRNMKKVYLQDR